MPQYGITARSKRSRQGRRRLLVPGTISTVPGPAGQDKRWVHKVPLEEGVLLGTIAEPDVEGQVFKAPNGRVTVYARLVGSEISGADPAIGSGWQTVLWRVPGR